MQNTKEMLEQWVKTAKSLVPAGRGMFARHISLWNELAEDSFLQRQLPRSAEGLPQDFSCDIKGLDTHRVTVCNGFVAGPAGKNLLYPEKDAVLGGEACVCRLGDLSLSGNARLQSFFKENNAELVSESGKIRRTADFAQGGPDADTERQAGLNRALPHDTLVVYLPAGCRLDKPLQLVNLCLGSEPLFVQPHCLVVLEKGASLSLVHCTDSHPQADILANALTEIHIEEGAELEYIQMQNVGDRCKIFHLIRADLQGDSKLNLHRITLNGGLTQNNTEINLLEPGAHAEVFGLYLQDRYQKVDNRVRINHVAPRTYSRELFKGVMDDSAQAYFQGHVFVSPVAQQTEAYQSCRNLLVSPKAQAYAKPYLEIYADDVQCNHGVTVGQLDEDALFYMRCRGISAESARRLLMRAYADEILKEISVEELRLWLVSLVKKRFSGQLQACQDCVLSCTGGEC
ncbi:MAG: Fe-S cluster assembly protein SufD [Bacteroides sp.]|nr:Fe-S cluster assembly protein SufD [Ruminococcus flavefaciens]MCM1554257.1 Fe-S cluster assembly protein SufD [Bacteroides sp.]